MYYMNNIGVGKHQNQTANINLTNHFNKVSADIQAMVNQRLATAKAAISNLDNKPFFIQEENQPKVANINQIRKAVVTLANQINKKIKNLSAAFKKAWAVIKGKVISTKVSGVSFGNTQKALQRLTRYNPQSVKTELVRESENQYDANAIAINVSVNNSRAYKIGYIGRELALYLSKLIDKGITLTAQFKGVTGGVNPYNNYGALIELKF